MISILLPDLRGGGAERVNLDLAQEFARAGHEVEFVLMQARGELLEEAAPAFPWSTSPLPAPVITLRARPLPAPASPRCVARRDVAAHRRLHHWRSASLGIAARYLYQSMAYSLHNIGIGADFIGCCCAFPRPWLSRC